MLGWVKLVEKSVEVELGKFLKSGESAGLRESAGCYHLYHRRSLEESAEESVEVALLSRYSVPLTTSDYHFRIDLVYQF